MDTSFDPTPDQSQASAEHSVRVDLATMTALENSAPVKNARPARTIKPVSVALELALSPAAVAPGYAPRMLDEVWLNTTPQRVALKLLTASLMADQAELIDGTRVVRPQQAIQWLLERIAVGIPSNVLDRLMEGAE
jgi:hypothetical protein